MSRTNHLDMDGNWRWRGESAGLRAGLILVSHDRELIEKAVTASWYIGDGNRRLKAEYHDRIRSMMLSRA